MTQQTWNVPTDSAAQLSPFPNGWPQTMLVTNISDNQDAIIYVGVDAQTNTVNGTPLRPGSSVQWSAGVPLYAISNRASARLNALDHAWNMFNPYAIAQAISGIGVPVINEITVIGTGTLAPGATTASFDLTPYATIEVIVYTNTNGGLYDDNVTLSFDSGTGGSVIPLYHYYNTAPLTAQLLNRWRGPAIASSMTLTNFDGNTVQYFVYGSLRETPPFQLSNSINTGAGAMQLAGKAGISTSGAVNIAAGATVDFHLGYTLSAPMTVITQKPAGLVVSADFLLIAVGVTLGAATPILYRKMWVPADPTNVGDVQTFQAPAGPLAMRVTNNDAAPRQIRFLTSQSPVTELNK